MKKVVVFIAGLLLSGMLFAETNYETVASMIKEFLSKGTYIQVSESFIFKKVDFYTNNSIHLISASSNALGFNCIGNEHRMSYYYSEYDINIDAESNLIITKKTKN